MPSSSGRITMACQRCHRKKVRCSGGDPLRNMPCHHCRSARADCIYPTRERNVTIPESYLRALESAINQVNGPAPAMVLQQPLGTSSPNQGVQNTPRRRFVENTTADAFVSRLRKLGTDRTNPNWNEGDDEEGANVEPLLQDALPSYEYFHLPSDRQATDMTLKLPPYPYAIHLIDQFEAYMGYEYHWYLRKSFRARLESTYMNPRSDASRDRTWLCRLLVVLALGETYNSRVAPCIELCEDAAIPRTNQASVATRPPGVEFFEQAMSLYKTPCEEATIDHVEALNLIAFYSYSLDRRRSAYIYAGLAMRIASSLMLHSPSTCRSASSRDQEHCRRLWWTTYQLDSMTGSEMGINSTFDFEEIEAKLGLPTDNGLSTEDHDEFASCTIFAAHICLCSIRSGILSIASAGLPNASFELIQETLRRPINVLEEWRNQLPSAVNFDFSNGLPPVLIAMPECRGLASLYLRFHQCFILLIRPIVLRYLGSAITGDSGQADQPSFAQLCNRCVEMARRNLNILTDLWQIDRIAKFGFWESLHLFTSIKIFLMAGIINIARPCSIVYKDPDDDIIYQNSKSLLHEMANVGNMASQGHIKVLDELERTRELIIGRIRPDRNEDLLLPDLDADIDYWLGMLDASPSNNLIAI